METPKQPNLSKVKRRCKNQTPESKFRLELDLCSKNKDLASAVSLYNSAISQRIRLNQHHFNSLLYLCSCSVTESPSSDSPDSSKRLALEHGFRIYDHMLSSNIPPNEASITAVARLAAAKGDGDFAFDLVKTMGKHSTMPRLRTYDPVLFFFCENLEADMAYEVEEHMGMVGVSAEEPEYSALLEVSVKLGREHKVYEYLHKLRSSVRCLRESTAKIIESWFSSAAAGKLEGHNVDADKVKEAVLRNGGGWHGLGWVGKGNWFVQRSKVNVGGHCCGCGEQLVCIDIDREETKKFAQLVASLALEREAKTNFGEFQAWLDQHGVFEAIVDGANIGLYQQNFSEGRFSISQLDAVVKEMHNRNQNKWPLVILHNKRFRALNDHHSDHKLLEEWMAQGLLYTTPNGSNDDWYWLYAAVKLRCLLVTNDEMRDHIFELLGRDFFLKWKERHQIRYTFVKGSLKLQMPPTYSLVIQESEKGSWHVPLAEEDCDEPSRTWLCITRSTSSDVPADSSEMGHSPISSSHKLLKPCSSKFSLDSNGENKEGVLAGKRKDRSPSPSNLY